MPLLPLTKRQAAILAYIVFRVDTGLPPTLAETMDYFSIVSTKGIIDHLTALVRKGYLLRDSGRARGLRVTKEYRAFQQERIEAWQRRRAARSPSRISP